MIDMSFEQSRPVINMLDHFQASITIIIPLTTLRSLLAALASLAVVYLMQANTRHAGFGNPVRIVRLVQRFAMATLATMLMLVAALPFLDGRGAAYHDLATILVTAPLLLMMICSIAVGQMTRDHAHPERAHIDS